MSNLGAETHRSGIQALRPGHIHQPDRREYFRLDRREQTSRWENRGACHIHRPIGQSVICDIWEVYVVDNLYK